MLAGTLQKQHGYASNTGFWCIAPEMVKEEVEQCFGLDLDKISIHLQMLQSGVPFYSN